MLIIILFKINQLIKNIKILIKNIKKPKYIIKIFFHYVSMYNTQ